LGWKARLGNCRPPYRNQRRCPLNGLKTASVGSLFGGPSADALRYAYEAKSNGGAASLDCARPSYEKRCTDRARHDGKVISTGSFVHSVTWVQSSFCFSRNAERGPTKFDSWTRTAKRLSGLTKEHKLLFLPADSCDWTEKGVQLKGPDILQQL
jgi:hypothetical protein